MRVPTFRAGRAARGAAALGAVVAMLVSSLMLPALADAAAVQYFDGVVNPTIEVASYYPAQHAITRSSARKVSGEAPACANARNPDGVIVGQWDCTYADNGLAQHAYCGCAVRTSVGKGSDDHAVRGRWQEDW